MLSPSISVTVLMHGPSSPRPKQVYYVSIPVVFPNKLLARYEMGSRRDNIIDEKDASRNIRKSSVSLPQALELARYAHTIGVVRYRHRIE